MIARHSNEQSDHGEGVEVVANAECTDEEHGKGQFTEKRIHLSRFVVCSENNKKRTHKFSSVLCFSQLPKN